MNRSVTVAATVLVATFYCAQILAQPQSPSISGQPEGETLGQAANDGNQNSPGSVKKSTSVETKRERKLRIRREREVLRDEKMLAQALAKEGGPYSLAKLENHQRRLGAGITLLVVGGLLAIAAISLLLASVAVGFPSSVPVAESSQDENSSLSGGYLVGAAMCAAGAATGLGLGIVLAAVGARGKRNQLLLKENSEKQANVRVRLFVDSNQRSGGLIASVEF